MAGTRWIPLDVDYFRNPKALAAGRDGRALHVASICWSGAHLTDGMIPREVVPLLLGESGARASSVDRLVAVGLWLPCGDGYEIHDYLAHNDSRDRVEQERKLYRDRAYRWRERKRDASRNASRNGEKDA